MKKTAAKTMSFALILCLMLCLFVTTATAEGKSMVIGDTTFNAENWEETVDPHRTYNVGLASVTASVRPLSTIRIPWNWNPGLPFPGKTTAT